MRGDIKALPWGRGREGGEGGGFGKQPVNRRWAASGADTLLGVMDLERQPVAVEVIP